MSFLDTESQIFSNRLDNINIEFMEAITNFVEEYYNDEYYSESKVKEDSFMTKINKFFANIINAFQNFQTQIRIEVDRKMRESAVDKKLHEAYEEIKKKKDAGASTVQVMDCWTLKDDYLACVNELRKYAKKFTEMKYKRVTEIDDDIAAFNKIIDKYDQKLQDDCDKEITVPVTKMLNFVEDEISGRSKVIESLNDGITMFKQMQHDCYVLQTRKEILGPDVISKHVGFIRKIAMSISGFFKRWTVKIITSVVLIIG